MFGAAADVIGAHPPRGQPPLYISKFCARMRNLTKVTRTHTDTLRSPLPIFYCAISRVCRPKQTLTQKSHTACTTKKQERGTESQPTRAAAAVNKPSNCTMSVLGDINGCAPIVQPSHPNHLSNKTTRVSSVCI
jgi:hypothetical protein